MRKIWMIRPVRFEYNPQTAVNNSFQQESQHTVDVNQRAQQEFDNFVARLELHDIDVLVLDDSPEPHTPDSIFPIIGFLFTRMDVSYCTLCLLKIAEWNASRIFWTSSTNSLTSTKPLITPGLRWKIDFWRGQEVWFSIDH